jgi:serine/threonine-protein kinase
VTADLRELLQHSLGATYTFERELGRGGMSRVFVATDRALGRRVAIKVLQPDITEGVSVARFQREIRLAARLQHPHIVPVHTSGEAGGLLYYVMPYVEGESLRHRLERETTLPVEDALRITLEIADALDCAHEHDIVHRDIKPENILLTRGHALVADFGVARALTRAADGAPGSTLTTPGFSVGTPAYMSPEQAVGERELDGRSDQYSLACVAYEMLSGAVPFAGSGSAIVAARFAQSPRTVTAVRPELSPQVDAVLVKALALIPAHRYRTACEFAGALRDALAAPAPRTQTIPPIRHARDWRRWLADPWVTLALLIALALGVGIVAWQHRAGHPQPAPTRAGTGRE